MSQETPFNVDAFDVRPKSQEGVWMTLLDPRRLPTGARFLIRGTDSDAYNDMLKAQIRRWADRAPRKATEDEKDAEFWELHATLIADWSGMATNDGPLPFSPAVAARLLKANSYIFEQVRRFADDRANFLPGPASS